MVRYFPRFVLPALLAGFTVAAAPAYAQLDQVYLAKGPPNKGVFVEMSKDAVTLTVNSIARPVPVNEIVKITFAEEPIALTNGRNATLAKNYKVALDELKKLDGQALDGRQIKSDVEYYKALCLARQAMTEGGDKPAALQALFAWVKVNPNSFHFYEAAQTLGDLAVASGQFSEAAKFYGGLSTAPWGDYQMRGNIAVGRALLAEKKYADALQRFDAVIGSELTTAEAAMQKLLATTGKAVCLAETGKPDEGIALLNDIIAKNDPQDKVLFARTYNALGNCYLKMNRPKDALQAFLFTEILFDDDPDSHAEALYRLSKLWVEVNKRERADQARATLKEKYAGSVWASLE